MMCRCKAVGCAEFLPVFTAGASCKFVILTLSLICVYQERKQDGVCVTLIPSAHAVTCPSATARAAVACGAGNVREAVFLSKSAPYNVPLVVTLGARNFGIG